MQGAQSVLDRAQRLVDSPAPRNGYSVAWYLQADMLGDLSSIGALAAMAARAALTADQPPKPGFASGRDWLDEGADFSRG
jgi:hypothetical protein